MLWCLCTHTCGLARQPISLADFKTAGADLKGIFYLRNVVDADRILEAIPEAKERGGRVRPDPRALSSALHALAHMQMYLPRFLPHRACRCRGC